jgi:8-oxo-dGTP diphosphatase
VNPSASVLHVVAGVIANNAGEVLVAQRTAGRDLAGAWEFPGGKVAPGESALAALARELNEELGITLLEAVPLVDYRHAYPGRVVRLDVWRVGRYRGEPEPREGQPLRWAQPAELLGSGLLPADEPIVAALLAGRLSTPSG